jgi:TolB-like protein/DNA-binding winged helix-turn-helix (wHTH) protein/Tfp pilus assembly protein PilF
MPKRATRFFDFGRFRLDPAEQLLLADGQLISLTPKAFETLLALVENNGHILEKDELLKRVWPDTFVEEGTLVQNISTLRKVLGMAADGRAFIETIPRRGYRFIGAVQEVDAQQAAGRRLPPTSSVGSPRTRISYGWIAALALAPLLVILFLARERIWPPSNVAQPKIMLAVLPFVNLTADPQQEYFINGLTEEMITQLGNLEPDHLGVIARTSAMQYADGRKDARQIGRELGVDYLIEGSVRREGDRVRITAQLIQIKDQTHLWAKEYDRSLRDLLDLQSDVANAVASEIQLKLTPEQTVRLANPSSPDPEAYELYLKGRYFWNKRTQAAYMKAIDYFQQAIARDPKYAQAYAGLADAYALLGSLSAPAAPMSRSEAMPKAKAAALTALQLDETLAEAHTSLAFVRMHYEWDWPGSESEFKRAIELNPNYTTAHQWYALWFTAQGHTDKALEQLRYAEKADPLSVIIKADTSETLAYARRYDQSEQEAKKALELDPNFILAYLDLSDAEVGKRNYSGAILSLQKALAIDSRNIWVLSTLSAAYALDDQRQKSEVILQGILKDAKTRSDMAYDVAQIYSALGEKDQAFAWLEKAFQYRDGGLILLNLRPEFRPLHLDPRYADLTRRLGLPSSVNADREVREGTSVHLLYPALQGKGGGPSH